MAERRTFLICQNIDSKTIQFYSPRQNLRSSEIRTVNHFCVCHTTIVFKLLFSEAAIQRFHRKRCAENMQQIYGRTPFIEITLRHGCSSVNLLHIFRTPFLKNTSGLLLLKIYQHLVYKYT